jgi:putative sterol carrier protein
MAPTVNLINPSTKGSVFFMIPTTDEKTLAYINMYAILGGLTALCDIVTDAGAILGRASCSIGFAVKDGPHATLNFVGGRCRLIDGTDECDILLRFPSCDKFNKMITGEYTPIPAHGLTKVSFLLGKFKKLTDLLEAYLRPANDKQLDDAFMRQSTLIMFRVIVAAVTQIGNHDKIGKFSASNIVNGVVKFEIIGCAKAAIAVEGHYLTMLDRVPKNITSYMAFTDAKSARDLFDGKINAVTAVGEGTVRMGGNISQIDNINKIMSRVELYLK